MRKIFFSKEALRYYVHTNFPNYAYQYSKLRFLPIYILEAISGPF